jgi:hypothetical protein
LSFPEIQNELIFTHLFEEQDRDLYTALLVLAIEKLDTCILLWKKPFALTLKYSQMSLTAAIPQIITREAADRNIFVNYAQATEILPPAAFSH